MDLHDPTVSITSPGEGANLTTSKVSVNWIGRDDETGIEKYAYQIDGGDWKEMKKSSITLYIKNGNHTIYVQAYDWAGRTAVDSITLSVNAPLPSVQITSKRGFINSPQYELEWGAEENDTWIDHFAVIFGDNATKLDNETTSYLFSLKEGEHTLTVKAYDRAGNTASDTVSITLDVSKPSLEVTPPRTARAT